MYAQCALSIMGSNSTCLWNPAYAPSAYATRTSVVHVRTVKKETLGRAIVMKFSSTASQR